MCLCCVSLGPAFSSRFWLSFLSSISICSKYSILHNFLFDSMRTIYNKANLELASSCGITGPGVHGVEAGSIGKGMGMFSHVRRERAEGRREASGKGVGIMAPHWVRASVTGQIGMGRGRVCKPMEKPYLEG